MTTPAIYKAFITKSNPADIMKDKKIGASSMKKLTLSKGRIYFMDDFNNKNETINFTELKLSAETIEIIEKLLSPDKKQKDPSKFLVIYNQESKSSKDVELFNSGHYPVQFNLGYSYDDEESFFYISNYNLGTFTPRSKSVYEINAVIIDAASPTSSASSPITDKSLSPMSISQTPLTEKTLIGTPYDTPIANQMEVDFNSFSHSKQSLKKQIVEVEGNNKQYLNNLLDMALQIERLEIERTRAIEYYNHNEQEKINYQQDMFKKNMEIEMLQKEYYQTTNALRQSADEHTMNLTRQAEELITNIQRRSEEENKKLKDEKEEMSKHYKNQMEKIELRMQESEEKAKRYIEQEKIKHTSVVDRIRAENFDKEKYIEELSKNHENMQKQFNESMNSLSRNLKEFHAHQMNQNIVLEKTKIRNKMEAEFAGKLNEMQHQMMVKREKDLIDLEKKLKDDFEIKVKEISKNYDEILEKEKKKELEKFESEKQNIIASRSLDTEFEKESSSKDEEIELLRKQIVEEQTKYIELKNQTNEEFTRIRYDIENEFRKFQIGEQKIKSSEIDKDKEIESLRKQIDEIISHDSNMDKGKNTKDVPAAKTKAKDSPAPSEDAPAPSEDAPAPKTDTALKDPSPPLKIRDFGDDFIEASNGKMSRRNFTMGNKYIPKEFLGQQFNEMFYDPKQFNRLVELKTWDKFAAADFNKNEMKKLFNTVSPLKDFYL